MTDAGAYLKIRDRQVEELLRERVWREAQRPVQSRRDLGPVYVDRGTTESVLRPGGAVARGRVDERLVGSTKAPGGRGYSN